MSASLMPIVNDLSRPFWDAANAGRLDMPYCVATGSLFWPPSPASPFLTAGQVGWRETEPAGTLISLVVYRRAFQAELAAALPFGIALVEIEPGVRLMVYVTAPDDSPELGGRVRIDFRALVEGGAKVPTLMQAGA